MVVLRTGGRSRGLYAYENEYEGTCRPKCVILYVRQVTNTNTRLAACWIRNRSSLKSHVTLLLGGSSCYANTGENVVTACVTASLRQ